MISDDMVDFIRLCKLYSLFNLQLARKSWMALFRMDHAPIDHYKVKRTRLVHIYNEAIYFLLVA